MRVSHFTGWALAAFLLTSASAAAQAPLGIDGTRLRAGTDTLRVLFVQGQDTTETGIIVDELRLGEQDGQRVVQRVYWTEDRVLGHRLDSLVDRLPTLAPVAHHSRSLRAIELLAFGDGRVRGVVRMANGDSLPIDVPLPTDAINSSSFDLALRAAPLGDGWQASISAFLPSTRTVVPLQARVTGSDEIAGTRCWRVEAEFTGMPVTFWIAEESRRLCQQVMRPRADMAIIFAPQRGRVKTGHRATRRFAARRLAPVRWAAGTTP